MVSPCMSLTADGAVNVTPAVLSADCLSTKPCEVSCAVQTGVFAKLAELPKLTAQLVVGLVDPTVMTNALLVPPAATLAPVPHDETVGVTFDNPPVTELMSPVVLAPIFITTSRGESVQGAAVLRCGPTTVATSGRFELATWKISDEVLVGEKLTSLNTADPC